MKFKIGDKVVVTEDIEDNLSHLIGKEAIVVNINQRPEQEFPIELSFIEKIDTNYSYVPELYKEKELELVSVNIELKKQFHERMLEVDVPKVLSVCVQLPSGDVETITNTQDTVTKGLYYMDNYDDEFKLKNNPKVQVIGFMIV